MTGVEGIAGISVGEVGHDGNEFEAGILQAF